MVSGGMDAPAFISSLWAKSVVRLDGGAWPDFPPGSTTFIISVIFTLKVILASNVVYIVTVILHAILTQLPVTVTLQIRLLLFIRKSNRSLTVGTALPTPIMKR